eukprot:859522-Prorocentrum_minimum.AAC.1
MRARLSEMRISASSWRTVIGTGFAPSSLRRWWFRLRCRVTKSASESESAESNQKCERERVSGE